MAHVTFDDDFLDVPGRDHAPVRVPAHGVGERTAGQVPDVEIQAAFHHLLKDAGTITRDDLFISTARTFGWNRRGQDITQRLDWVLRRLRERGEISVNGETISRRSSGER